MIRQSFSKLLDLEANNFERLRFLGEAGYLWSDLGQLDKASEIFEAMKILAPHDPVSHLGLAGVHLARQQFRQAEVQAIKAARVASSSPSSLALAYNLRGDALVGLNKPAEAQKAWQKALRADPDGAGGTGATERIQIAEDRGILPKQTPGQTA